MIRPRSTSLRAASLATVASLTLACDDPMTEPEPEPLVVPDSPRCEPVTDDSPLSQPETEEALLVAITDMRARGGRCGALSFLPAAPLHFDPSLRCAARLHTADMVTRMYLGAIDPDGRGTGARLAEVEHTASSFAQAVGFARATADNPEFEPAAAADIAATWADNPSTCWQLRARELTEIGVGAVPGDYAFKDMEPTTGVYFSAIFAAP